MRTQKHIAIVGAGPGGLCAGMLLAHRGFKVSIFDKNPEAGGRSRPFRSNGYVFDTGPTVLMMKGVLDEIFELCGRRSEDYLRFTPLDPMYELVYGDRKLRVFSDQKKMCDELEQVFGEGEYGYRRFIIYERERFNHLYPLMQRDFSSFGAMLSWSALSALSWLALSRNKFENLALYFRNEQLRQAFSYQLKYLGMSPWEAPGFFTMLPYLELDYGIYHVEGGLNRIAAAMAKVIEELGGNIYTDTSVQSLLLEKRSVKGVRLASGEEIRADEVIVNADFTYAMSNLVAPGVLRKYSREQLQQREYSCSAFMLYLGLGKCYDLPHHTIVFAGDYQTNMRNLFNAKSLPADFSYHVQNPCATDPSMAPPGKSSLYIMAPMPNNASGIDWDMQCAAVREQILDSLQTRLGLTGIREHIECEKIITPALWESDENVYQGAIFSLAHKFKQMLYWRPHNRFEELDHCYLVGGGTHPGSALPFIYQSARITANLIARKHRVKYQDSKKSTWLKTGRK